MPGSSARAGAAVAEGQDESAEQERERHEDAVVLGRVTDPRAKHPSTAWSVRPTTASPSISGTRVPKDSHAHRLRRGGSEDSGASSPITAPSEGPGRR
jgi:hypothetical protein